MPGRDLVGVLPTQLSAAQAAFIADALMGGDCVVVGPDHKGDVEMYRFKGVAKAISQAFTANTALTPLAVHHLPEYNTFQTVLDLAEDALSSGHSVIAGPTERRGMVLVVKYGHAIEIAYAYQQHSGEMPRESAIGPAAEIVDHPTLNLE